MLTSSAKAKGRKLQQWVRTLLIEKLNIHPEDIESRSMGASGEDLIMARAARKKFPLSIDDIFNLCKKNGLKIKWFNKESFMTKDDSGQEIKSLFKKFIPSIGKNIQGKKNYLDFLNLLSTIK